jgi:hypothetical protein
MPNGAFETVTGHVLRQREIVAELERVMVEGTRKRQK